MSIAAVGNGYPAPELPIDLAPRRERPEAERARREAERDQVVREAVDIGRTTAELERISLAFNKKLRFSVNEDLDQVVVKVIDPETDKVIKELPPEELQRLHVKIKEMIGILFDERA